MNYYDKNAKEFFERTVNCDMSVPCKKFADMLLPASTILDCGCGSGRDLKYFKELGYDPEGLEPSKKLCQYAEKYSGCKVFNGTVQEFKPKKKYDGIWACASLLHLEKKEILLFFNSLDQWLKPGGYIYASGKSDIETGIAVDGRFFQAFDENLLDEILNLNDRLELVEKWYSDDVNGRNQFRWLNFIIKFS